MAFDVKKNKRLASEDITEVDSDNNESTLDAVNSASTSNVIATQSWVSKMLKMFCRWTRLFHTDVLHATSEVVTANVKSREAHLGDIYANSIVLTNEDGGMVRIKVGKDGKIDIQETLCDVFVYPGECLVREYLYRSADVMSNFAGLTPYQTLLNFVPFIGWKRSEFNGQMCYILCTADGKDEYVGKTLLFSIPPDKVARKLVVLDSDGQELKSRSFPYVDNIRQLTINLPRFYNTETGEMRQVMLPEPSSTWTGRSSEVFPSPIPPPPISCSGFVPPDAKDALPDQPQDIGTDIYNDDVDSSESEINSSDKYEVIQDDYSGNTYYNVSLKRNFFPNDAKAQYLVLELMDRTSRGNETNYWSDDTQYAD